jgi:hypothetical protein
MLTCKIAKEIFDEVSQKLDSMGKNNPRVFERQSLYGDVLDWLKDYHSELVNDDFDDDLVAFYIVGRYTTIKG